MDLERMNIAAKKFVTNVGLITSNGEFGDNIMSAEWTHHVSYSPGYIMINLQSKKATIQNILKSREFGVNIATESQNIVSSVAGKVSGREYDKISVLKELGVEFYRASKINVLMVKGAAMNVECILIKEETLGDHTALIGEVVEVSGNEEARPLLFHGSRYYKLGENIPRPDEETLKRIDELFEKNKKANIV